MSFIKGGLVYADLLTTVSQQYAKELQSEEYGCGMEPTLKLRAKNFIGILNGIDHSVWNPETDKELEFPYSAKNWEGKLKCKEALQKAKGLEIDPAAPLFGFVGRLAGQKGLDLLLPLLPELLKLKAQIILLGMGEAAYEKKLKEFFQKNKKESKSLSIQINFDPVLAKRIFAGADLYLMPSHFEPCGLGQMIAMRYGTVPLVRSTGGLKETVQDFDQKKGAGNGIVFHEYSQSALLNAMKRAVTLYREKKAWHKIVANCFKADFSWEEQAKQYTNAYESLFEKKTAPKKISNPKGKGNRKNK
jgi:starch synthase